MDIRRLPLVVDELVCSLSVCSNMLRAHFVQDCHVPLLLIVPWICLCCVWYLRLFSCYFTGLSCCSYDRFTLRRSSSKKKSMYVWFTCLLGFCRSVLSWIQGSCSFFVSIVVVRGYHCWLPALVTREMVRKLLFPSSWVRFAIVKPYDFFAIVGVFALQGFGDRLCSCSDHLKPVV